MKIFENIKDFFFTADEDEPETNEPAAVEQPVQERPVHNNPAPVEGKAEPYQPEIQTDSKGSE